MVDEQIINKMPNFSVVIPCYCSGQWISQLVGEILDEFEKIKQSFEILLINDCSPDDNLTNDAIKKLCQISQVRGIELMTNVGQHKAICCGLDNAKGNTILIMDDDFQNNPKDISNMINNLEVSGNDVIIGTCKRKQAFYRSMGSIFVRKILRRGLNIPAGMSPTSFVLMNSKLKDTILSIKGANPILSPLIFKSTNLIGWETVSSENRKYGNSGYSYSKLVNATMDNYVAATKRPLRVYASFGVLVVFCSISFISYSIYLATIGGNPPPGYTSIVASIFFFGGFNILGIGIMGEYIGRLLSESITDPIYVIREEY